MTTTENTENIATYDISNAQLLTETIRFEHWARFHCMREIANDNETQEDSPENTPNESTANDDATNENIGRAFIHVPEVLVHISNEEEPHLSGLLELIQNSEISLESARDHILTFLQEKLELNQDDFAQEIQAISTSKKFTRYLDVFYTFVQEEADLEETELEAKEKEIGIEAMAQYVEEIPIPTFTAWTETFHQWANKRNFKLEL